MTIISSGELSTICTLTCTNKCTNLELMKKTSVASLRNDLSSLLDYVEKGKEIEIQRRNIPIAKIVPIKRSIENRTRLGSGKGTVKFLGSVTEPIIDNDWDMHR